MGSVIPTILHDDKIVKGFNIIIATVNVKWMLNPRPLRFSVWTKNSCFWYPLREHSGFMHFCLCETDIIAFRKIVGKYKFKLSVYM